MFIYSQLNEDKTRVRRTKPLGEATNVDERTIYVVRDLNICFTLSAQCISSIGQIIKSYVCGQDEFNALQVTVFHYLQQLSIKVGSHNMLLPIVLGRNS